MTTENLVKLIEHSVRIGSSTDLVQSSGGNVSQKTESKLWVKGSGKYLKDAQLEDIFVEIDIENLTDEEILRTEEFAVSIPTSNTPSIETNLHIILKKKYVTHLHSLGSVSLGISDFSKSSIFIKNKIRFIPYARPGIDLAKKIYDSKVSGEDIIVLKNHGVIFAGETIEEIEEKIISFENLTKSYLDACRNDSKYPDWIEILTSGVLTPDEAVFLGQVPFIRSESPKPNSIAIKSNGEIFFPPEFTQSRIEMANFYVKVAKLIEKKTKITYISQNEIQFLLNWDKEKNRIRSSK